MNTYSVDLSDLYFAIEQAQPISEEVKEAMMGVVRECKAKVNADDEDVRRMVNHLPTVSQPGKENSMENCRPISREILLIQMKTPRITGRHR